MILYRGQKRNAEEWMCNTISCCGYFSQVSVEIETGATSWARWQWGSMLFKQPLKDKGPDVCEGSAKGGIAFPQPPKHPFVLWVWIVQKVDSSVQRSTADVSILSDWLVAISPIYPFIPHTKTQPVNLTLHQFLAKVFTLKPTHTQLSCLPQSNAHLCLDFLELCHLAPHQNSSIHSLLFNYHAKNPPTLSLVFYPRNKKTVHA